MEESVDFTVIGTGSVVAADASSKEGLVYESIKGAEDAKRNGFVCSRAKGGSDLRARYKAGEFLTHRAYRTDRSCLLSEGLVWPFLFELRIRCQ